MSVLDGEGATLSDADGRFSLRVPPRAALLVVGEGQVPTLSPELDFGAGPADVEVASVPRDFSTLLHGLAGFELTEVSSTVVLTLQDEAPLPLQGVEVTLLEADGSEASVNTRRRVLAYQEPVFQIQAGPLSANTGVVGFFGVPPGVYRARITREGYTFPEVVLPARPGTVTLGRVRGQGLGAATLPTFHGAVTGQSPGTNQWRALSDAEVRLQYEDGTVLSGRTDADGGYAFVLPRLGQRFDVTAESATFAPLRSPLLCAGHWAAFDLRLTDRYISRRNLGYLLGERALAPDAGWATVGLKAGSAGIAGARLWLTPDAGEPFYGEDPSGPWGCARGSCGDGGACADGLRCQQGECVVGASGPLCQACAASGCPSGFAPQLHPRAGAGSGCYCIPTTAGCDLATPSCGPGAYCWRTSEEASSSAACVLRRPLLEATVVGADGEPWPVSFTNLPEGVVEAQGQLPDAGLLPPLRLRISPGVSTSVWLQVP